MTTANDILHAAIGTPTAVEQADERPDVATSGPPPEPVIRLTAAERDTLASAVQHWLTGGEQPLGEDRAEAILYQAQVAECIRFRDEMGWRVNDDQEHFDLTLGPCLIAEISDLLDDLTQQIQRDAESRALARQESGAPDDRDHWFAGCSTAAEVDAMYAEILAQEDREHELCATILDRLAACDPRVVVLSRDELLAAAEQRQAQLDGEVGVDWCTQCGAFPAEGQPIDPATQMCEPCRQRSRAFEAGARYAAASAFGAVRDQLSAWFTADEVDVLLDDVRKHGSPSIMDGHAFSWDDEQSSRPPDNQRKLEAARVVDRMLDRVGQP